MLKPDVTLTDYAVTVECLVLLWILRRRDGAQRAWLALFLLAVALAAVTAGTVHGYYPAPTSRANAVLWRLTMLGLGTGALAAWGLGAGLLLRAHVAQRATGVAALAFVAYAVVVLWVSPAF